MVFRKIQGLVVTLVMVAGLGVTGAGGASAAAAPAAPAAVPASVVLSLGGEQIAVTAADLAVVERTLVADRLPGAAPRAAVAVPFAPALLGAPGVRLAWVNPITVAKCVLEIASFVFGSAGKLAYIGAKIMKVVNKSAKLKALLNKVGGVKAALKGLWDKLKGHKMTPKHRADVDGFWKGLAKQAGSIAGIGNCLSLF